MIDNLDEAIAHAKEVAENWKSQLVNCVSEEGRNKCLECVAEHEKIAEWLTELRDIRKVVKDWQDGKINDVMPMLKAYSMIIKINEKSEDT